MSHDYFKQNIILLIEKKLVNFKVPITEMYSRIPWELATDPLRFVEHTLGTSALYYSSDQIAC